MGKIRRFYFGIVLLPVLLSGGCGGNSAPAVAPMPIDADAGEKAVKQFDANNDGKLDYNELAKAPGLRAGVAKIKKLEVFRGPPATPAQLQSATITAEEINARIQEWKSGETAIVRIPVACRVVRAGRKGSKAPPQPVAGAEVKFVPESFQGSGLLPGSATTDNNGYASVAAPGEKGMSPGFYRVEISKGAEIPAKYNKETTLGAEAAPDSTTSRVFELDY